MVTNKEHNNATELDAMLTRMHQLVIQRKYHPDSVTPLFACFLQGDLALLDVQEGQDGTNAVVHYRTPEELYKTVDFSLPDVGAGVDGKNLCFVQRGHLSNTHLCSGTFDLIKDTLQYSVNSWNPRFMDKLYAGTNPIGVISEFLLAVLNGNGHVYHVSPVLTLMEIEVTKAVGKLLGMGEVSLPVHGLFVQVLMDSSI